ncbi:MAG: hypothetical protein Q9206_007029 [Seirophora lacunosa]
MINYSPVVGPPVGSQVPPDTAGSSPFSFDMPPRRPRTAAAAGDAFLQALNAESPPSDAATMFDWLRRYAHAENERFFDRRCTTVLEAAQRLQEEVDRRGRGRRRDLRHQNQAGRAERAERERLRREREQARREQVERERQEQAEQARHEQVERERLRREQNAAPSDNDPPPPRRRDPPPGPTVEDAPDDADDDRAPSDEPSPSPEPRDPGPRPSPSQTEDGPTAEGGEGQRGTSAAVDRGDGSADTAAGAQVVSGRAGAIQPDRHDRRDDDATPVDPAREIIGPQTPLRLTAPTDEPHYRATLDAILQVPEVRSLGGSSDHAVKLLLELVASWFDVAPYKALGESMTYIIERTATADIPRDAQDEPTPGHSLCGKRFDGDPPASLERLRDRWNNTRSTCCLGNKFWQHLKFRLAAMELYIHWDYLQMVFASEKPELQADQAYLQQLVRDAPGDPHPTGRKTVDALKRAVAPYLGIRDDNGDDRFWKYAMKLGRHVAVFKQHWGLVALARTRILLQIPASLLDATIPLCLDRHPSVRGISLVIFYNYVQPLWSEGSLSDRCRHFAASVLDPEGDVEEACRENPKGLMGLFGYREAGPAMVPEMTGALHATPSPPDAPMTPPPTTARTRGVDDADAVFDAGPDDERATWRDHAASSSSEVDRLAELSGPLTRAEE